MVMNIHPHTHTQARCGQRGGNTYVLVAQSLQQEQQDRFEVFVPHGHVVLPRDLQQIHQGALALLRALVVIGQLLQQVGDQV